MVEEILPLLLDVRSVWAVKVGAAFYIFIQQISARFDVTFQCRNKERATRRWPRGPSSYLFAHMG